MSLTKRHRGIVQTNIRQIADWLDSKDGEVTDVTKLLRDAADKLTEPDSKATA